jgi:hypothetical protein
MKNKDFGIEMDYHTFLEWYKLQSSEDKYSLENSPPRKSATDSFRDIWKLDKAQGYITILRSKCCNAGVTYRAKIAPKTRALAVRTPIIQHSLMEYREYYQGDITPDSGYLCNKCGNRVFQFIEKRTRRFSNPTLYFKPIAALDPKQAGYLVFPRTQAQMKTMLNEKLDNYHNCLSTRYARGIECENIYNCKHRNPFEKANSKASENTIGQTCHCTKCPPYSISLVNDSVGTRKMPKQKLVEFDYDSFIPFL